MAHSGATPELGLPYPIEDDDVEVPLDMQALAESVEALLSYPVVDELPLSPVNGDRITLDLSDNSNGYGGRFRLQRVAGVWLCIGGTPAHLQRDVATAIPPTGSVVIGTDEPLYLDLVPGEWEIEWGFEAFRPVSSPAGLIITSCPQGDGIPTLANGGAPNPECIVWAPGFALGTGFAQSQSVVRSRRFTLTGSGIASEAYTALNGSCQASKRWVKAWPIRL